MHFVQSQRIAPMIKTLEPFIPGITGKVKFRSGHVTIPASGKPFKASFTSKNVDRGIRVTLLL